MLRFLIRTLSGRSLESREPTMFPVIYQSARGGLTVAAEPVIVDRSIDTLEKEKRGGEPRQINGSLVEDLNRSKSILWGYAPD